MTPSEMKEFGKKEVTITRERVAQIIAARLAEEKITMKHVDLDPFIQTVFMAIMQNVCADVLHEIFNDDTLEVE